jgi:integrase
LPKPISGIEFERDRLSDDRGVQTQTNEINYSLRATTKACNGEPGTCHSIWHFQDAVDYEEISDNPCRKVESLPENNQRIRHLSFEKEDRLFAKLTGERDYLRPLVTVAIYAGPRRGELLKLRWSNVDFGLNLINFTETKTNRDRAVPMKPIVREALLELSQHNGNAQYVFTNPDTAMRYADVKKSFSATCREAGITNFTFHDLRHTFGTRLADAGVDVVKIKELMGHASIVTTMRSSTQLIKGSEERSPSCQSIGRNDITSLSQMKNGRLFNLP